MIGRSDELSAVTDLITENRLVTIVGPGGVGKSTLARAVTDHVSLRGVTADLDSLTGERLHDEVAGTAGFTSWDDMVRYLHGDVATLLLLDNAEHLIDQLGHLVEDVLGSHSNVVCLVTSREALGMPEERVFMLRPLSVEGEPSPAAELFLNLVEARGLPRPDSLDDVERLCRSLDGLPLAIELAAGRATALTPAEIRRSVETRLDLLSRARPRRTSRRDSLDVTIAWSIDLLDPPDRWALETLSILEGPFTLELASGVIGSDDPAATASTLQSLVERSLLVHEARGGLSWYQMLNTIRVHCRNRLARENRLEEAREQSNAAILDLCRRLATPAIHMGDPRIPDQVARNYRNIRAAIESAMDRDVSPDALADLVMPLYWLEDVGFQAETAELLTLIIQRRDDLGPAYGTVWGVLANLLRVAGETRRARDAALTALRAGAGFGSMLALRVLGIIDRQAGEVESALVRLAAGAEMARDLGLEAHALEMEAHAALARHAAGATDDALETLADLDERARPYPLCHRCIRIFSGHALLAKDTARAASMASSVREEATRYGHLWAVGTTAYQQAVAAMIDQDDKGATEHLVTALRVFDASHQLIELRQALLLSAALLTRLGKDPKGALAAASKLPNRTPGRPEVELFSRLGIDPYAVVEDLPVPPLDDVIAALETEEGAASDASSNARMRHRAWFRRQGEMWEVGFDGVTAMVRHSKGMDDLATLIGRPRREVPALDLMGAHVEEASTGPLIDGRARSEYERRVRDLQTEIEDAETENDPVRAERAKAELDELLDGLSKAYGLGGKPRPGRDTAERARSAVTWRIRSAIDRIHAQHQRLGDHLRRSIRTGRFCVYDPELELEWELDTDRDMAGSR